MNFWAPNPCSPNSGFCRIFLLKRFANWGIKAKSTISITSPNNTVLVNNVFTFSPEFLYIILWKHFAATALLPFHLELFPTLWYHCVCFQLGWILHKVKDFGKVKPICNPISNGWLTFRPQTTLKDFRDLAKSKLWFNFWHFCSTLPLGLDLVPA